MARRKRKPAAPAVEPGQLAPPLAAIAPGYPKAPKPVYQCDSCGRDYAAWVDVQRTQLARESNPLAPVLRLCKLCAARDYPDAVPPPATQKKLI